MKKPLVFLAMMLCAISAYADQSVVSWWDKTFLAPDRHLGLVHAYEQFQPEQIKQYAVLLQDGIPAEQPPNFITWQDYDYRVAVIDGQKIKTRRGKAYTRLRKGTVLAVVAPDHFANRLYVKLISAEPYRAADDHAKEIVRVTVMLGFKFPRSVLRKNDPALLQQTLDQWLKLFSTRAEAEQFALAQQQVQ